MKSIQISIIVALSLSFAILSAQPRPEFECATVMNSNASVGTSATCTPEFDRDYNNAPIINMYVNVHIWNSNENLADAVLVDRVRQLIRVCNETLDNMQLNFRNGPNGQPAPRVEDAKIRLKLYSETTNTADVNGGIWVYPTPRMWDLAFITTIPNDNSPAGFPEYVRRYNNVIDIMFVNFGTRILNGQRTASATGYTAAGEDYIVHADLNGAFEADAINGTTNEGDLIWRSVARALNHEIGHILGLAHTYECGYTQCLVDVDVNLECGSTCPNFSPCGGFNNGDRCPVTNAAVCLYGNSHNIMANSWSPNVITQCQWERAYENAINSNATFIRDCANVANLTLTTSPGVDYRATQMITSTSVIATNRDVTYQAPTIVMNSGFQVPLGTAFLASPSTFPCCDPPSSLYLPENEFSSMQVPIAEQKLGLKVFPIPFTDKLTIQATKMGMKIGQENLSLQLIDLNGRIVHTATMMAASSEITLNVSNIPPGQYFVKIMGKNANYTYRATKL
ncbi:zinc-dependent metalloprotease [Haliscomenobacter hydrossis]|uniref:Secretion system C-terminal sorting domain-containing protein n=1 Tax=Haliscomenobacter hydrossis (strain ATCC 27775 / DSM 1100 / LMG 10767 / O) TaxID=760192 RepID=F4KPY4_HALH1|nr:T9SS type A sorting domain-containing protein [Haliscomenobacter hydrossis]AEE53188.1 hypothetical protein Halhy_5363 [Haliscomenobacter hydrossis DSM 1100]